jgi:hypothetical protein
MDMLSENGAIFGPPKDNTDRKRIERYLVHIEVFDNKTGRPIVREMYNTNSLTKVWTDLEEITAKIDKLDEKAQE